MGYHAAEGVSSAASFLRRGRSADFGGLLIDTGRDSVYL